MSRTVVCARCHRQRRHKAHGLCESCYKQATVRTPKLAPNTRWADKAACASIRNWNPRRSDGWPGMTVDQKRVVCETQCPVRAQCLNHGTRDPYAEGTYGGEYINNRKDTAA